MSVEQQKNTELKKFNSSHTKYFRNNKIIIKYEKENNHLLECHLCENFHVEQKEQVNEFCKISFV